MRMKKIISCLCVAALLLASMPTVTLAAIEAGLPGAIDYYSQEWDGKTWLMSNMTVDDAGNKEQMAFVNGSGNLELHTYNEMSHDRVYAQFPYSVNDDGTISSYDTENQLTFMDEANFDIEFRMRYDGQVFFMTQWHHSAARLEFKDNRITIDDGNGNRNSVSIVDDGEWHNYTVRVRGNNCKSSASSGPDCIRFVRIFMDGREIYNFYTTRYAAAYRTYKFYMDNDYDQESWAEVEYVNITNKATTVKINSHISGDVIEAGTDVTLTADAGAADEEQKTVDFYIGDVKVGSGTDQGTITTVVEGTGCDGDTTTTDPAKDASITLSALPAGTYTIKAVCDGVESPDVQLFVKNTLAAEIVAPETADSSEGVNLSVTASGNPTAARVEYYLNGVLAGESAEGDTFPVSISGVPVGTAAVYAKVYAEDGTTVNTDTKVIRITTTDVSNAAFNREYQLDYTAADSGSVNVKDGYFELSMTHSGDTVTYKDETGTVTSYSGTLGAGEYKVITTAGNAEVYYNGQFAFSFLMPNCYDAQGITYSGLENFTLGGTGVKKTYLHKDWGTEKDVSEYLSEFGNYFSVEYDKMDTSAETLMVYDGLYEIVVSMDDTGIWVNRQPTVGAPTEKYKVADSFTAGYYRITVAEGMAQIFCNNKVLGTWRSPLTTHRPAVIRSVTEPSATSFIALKGTDDVYYHSEDFEGNIESGFTADDYWFDETDARIESEEIEAAYKHEIVTEEENNYLKMTGEGTYFLNVMTHNPSFKWKSYFDGTDGGFAVRFRDAIKYDFSEIGYDAANAQWYVNNSNKKLTTIYDTEDSDGDGITTEALSTYYESSITELATAAGGLDTGWHEYELVLNGTSAKLLCDGAEVISAEGLRNSYGRIGFKISGSGALGIDNVEYSGEGRATAGLSYVTNGRTDFYRNFQGKIIAATSSAGYSWYESEDNGETWTEISSESVGGEWLGSRSGNNLNLLSGLFLRVRYSGKYTYAYLYDETTNASRNGTAKGTEYTAANSTGVCIEPAGSMDNVPYSGMPSRLMQIQSGPYKGRVIYCRGGSGEIYGRTFMYWSDDYDGVDDPVSTQAVWHEAEVQLSYFNTGYNIQESLMVDMPDGTLRYYVRTELGHLAYFTSSDGGETWDEPVEMKTENLIAPMCCYSIQRVGDTNTYYSFWEYDVITANLTYLEAPRNRRALAVSYDGMETWEYVADIEEEGLSANSTSSVCNHGMRYLDGAVYMSYYHGNGLHKMFRIDETKMKPLERFTSLHYRSQNYASVSDFQDQECVIPKTSGEAYVYGSYIYTEVNENGLADADVVAKAVGATCSVSGETATLTLGSATITFTNGSASYSINGTATTADEVCYETGYLNPRIVAEIFGKYVSESSVAYVISNDPLAVEVIEQIEGVGAEKTAEETKSSALLDEINAASAADDGNAIHNALTRYSDVLTFAPDTTSVKNADEVFARMTGIEYRTAEDIEKVFDKALAAQKEAEAKTSGVALSTVSGAFTNWSLIGKNRGTAADAEGVITLSAKAGFDETFVCGTPGLDMPQKSYSFTFDYMPTVGESETTIKLGNTEKLIQFAISPKKISVFGSNTTEAEVDLAADTWYTITGTVNISDSGTTLSLGISDGGELDLAVCEDKSIVASSPIRGFWASLDDGQDSTVQLRNVRVYSGKAIDVISYSAENGTATVSVDFLNDNVAVSSGQMIVGVYNDGKMAGYGMTEVEEETIDAYGSKRYTLESFSYNIKENVTPTVKFFIWKSISDLTPMAEASTEN